MRTRRPACFAAFFQHHKNDGEKNGPGTSSSQVHPAPAPADSGVTEVTPFEGEGKSGGAAGGGSPGGRVPLEVVRAMLEEQQRALDALHSEQQRSMAAMRALVERAIKQA